MSDDMIFILLIVGVVLFWVILILIILRARKRLDKKYPLLKRERPAKRAAQPEAVPVPDGLEEILARVKENTRRESIRLLPQEGPAPGLFDSKIGGLPYWDLTKAYPTDREGQPLALLAQIDLSRLPENGRLPKEGLLQFFIRPDDMYGMDLKDNEDPDGFRVVWHERVDTSVTEDKIRAQNWPNSFTCGYDLPVSGEFALAFQKETVHLGDEDELLEEELRRAAGELKRTLPEDFSLYKAIGRTPLYDEWAGTNAGSRMLGYPWFVQGDPRPADTPYDTLLFQLDSYFSGTPHPGQDIMWGDAGVGNFFIRSRDLEEKRFDRIYYTLDCG